MSEFPSRRDLSDRQRHVVDRVMADAQRTAEMQSTGQYSYRVYSMEIEELRYDEEQDDLIPTDVYLCGDVTISSQG